MLKLINTSIFILIFFHLALSQTSCNLSGYVYNTGCGTGESGVTVDLYYCGGPWIAQTTSGSTGLYKFLNVQEGYYDIVGTYACQTGGGISCYHHLCSIPIPANFCMGAWNCDQFQFRTDNNLVNIETYKLLQNFPNPFNPTTVIQYDIPTESFVTLNVYDITGKEIQTLVNETETAGSHQISFNAEGLPSGMYFYTIKAGDFTETKKMLLIK